MTIYTGKHIAAYCERHNLSRAKFAHRVGVKAGTVKAWEDGKSRPGKVAYRKIQALMRDDSEAQS